MNATPIIKKDLLLVLLVLLVAAILRLPNLAFPDRTMFDEVVYREYTLMTLEHRPHFDIHPPLAKLLMLFVTKAYPSEAEHVPVRGGEPFGDFPYVPMRTLVAVFGIALPAIVYGIARAIGQRPLVALIPAALVALDNALILYSRAILPDMILLSLEFAGLLFAIIASRRERGGTLLGVISIALFALAIAVKWTALGMLFVGALFLLSGKRYAALASGVLIVPLVYALAFSAYLSEFPEGGRLQPVIVPYVVPWIEEASFPKGGGIDETLAFIPLHTELALRANTDPEVNAEVFRAAPPIRWPLGASGILFWHSRGSMESIHLMGNVVAWTMAILAFAVYLARLAVRTARKRPIDRPTLILAIGALANYLPFLVIDRPLYLYHYFATLLLLFLLVPEASPLFATMSEKRRRALIALVIAIVAFGFIVILPETYGCSFGGWTPACIP